MFNTQLQEIRSSPEPIRSNWLRPFVTDTEPPELYLSKLGKLCVSLLPSIVLHTLTRALPLCSLSPTSKNKK